ncbi:MAG TPA: UbiA family prenyltransferase [Egibacteraceae bacterium]|nr:UbiA family prenyltransferase [Egibacteraceae bacterium]
MYHYLRAGHLEPTLAVTAVTCLLAFGAGRSAGGVAWVAAAVLAGQLSVAWANDWLDHERDRAAGRTDKPAATGALAATKLRDAALMALGACALLSLASGVRAAAVHLLAVGAGWAYNLGLKRTAASVVPYALAFALLPVFVWLGLGGARLPPWWAVVAASLLGSAGHFTQALADLDADARTGVRGLPQRLGPRGSVLATAGLLGAGAAVIAAGRAPLGAVPAAAVAASLALVAGLLAAGLRGRTHLALHLTIAAAGAVLVAFLARVP